jgi:hypothetical protein
MDDEMARMMEGLTNNPLGPNDKVKPNPPQNDASHEENLAALRKRCMGMTSHSQTKPIRMQRIPRIRGRDGCAGCGTLVGMPCRCTCTSLNATASSGLASSGSRPPVSVLGVSLHDRVTRRVSCIT